MKVATLTVLAGLEFRRTPMGALQVHVADVVGGPLVILTPDTLAVLDHWRRELRRADDGPITTIYRPDLGIEVSVDGEYVEAEPEVGIASGGWTTYGATRVDTGEAIELTDLEREEIARERDEARTEEEDEP